MEQTKMRILVDADACPVVGIVERIAKENEIPCMLLCDTNHVLSSDYSDIKIIGAGADAVICHGMISTDPRKSL